MVVSSFMQRLTGTLQPGTSEGVVRESEGELLYEYHKLEEKDATKIKAYWSGLQIMLLTFCIFFSFLAFVFICNVINYFDGLCVFYPKNITFNVTSFPLGINKTDCDNCTVPNINLYELNIDFIKSAFSDHPKCFWPYFFPVLSIFYSIMWLTFFIMFKGLKHPWRIVIPALIFITAFSICCYVFEAKYIKGALHFEDVFVNASKTANVESHYQVRNILIFMNIYVYSVWLNTVSWTLAALLLFLRLISAADFEYILVQVELIKLNPDDLPLLSQFDDSTISLQSLALDVKKNKNLVSILKSPKGTRKDKQSPKITINPMTVFVDVETEKPDKSQNGKALLSREQLNDATKEDSSERRSSTSSNGTKKSRD